MLYLLQWILCACALTAAAPSNGTNRLYEEGRIGHDIVARAIRAVQERCDFPNDFQFLRRVALVESDFGATLTSRWGEPTGENGIWQMTPQMLSRAKQYSSSQPFASVYESNRISHTSDSHNLKVPYWAAVAAHLYLSSCQAGRSAPASVSEQAALWSSCWHANARPASDFVARVSTMSLPCASAGADILFIVDSSGSIRSDQYEYARGFISKVLDELDVGENAFQVAIDIFSDSVEHSLNFMSGRDKAYAKQVAGSLRYLDSGTDTTSALRMAQDYSFTTAHGARSRERAFARIAVLITDGFPNHRASSIQAAANLKNAGVKLFAVGVGSSISEEYLRSVASAPICSHVFQLTNYETLAHAFPTELKMRLCEDMPPNESDPTDIISCTARGSLAFGRQMSLNTYVYQAPAFGTTIRVCARGILHAFFSDSERSPGPAAFDQFISIENLNASAPVCKQVQLRSQATGKRVYFTVMGKDSDGPVAFDTECLVGLRGGDDREGFEDRRPVQFGGPPAGNASAWNASGTAAQRGKLVKDQELVLRFTNVSAGRVELELCAEQGDALLYLSQTNTQPSEANNQLKLDTQKTADGRHCVRAAALVNASCDPQTLHTSVLGAGRLNRFQLMLSQKAPEAILLNTETSAKNESTLPERLYCGQSAELLATYSNADYEIDLCTTRGVVQLVVRDVVAKAVERFQNTSAGEKCSHYTLNRELIEQRSENVSLLAKLRGTESLNEFTLRGKRVIENDAEGKVGAMGAMGAKGASPDAMQFEKLLPLAAVVAGALLLVAAAGGGGVLVKTLVANSLNKGQYLVDKKERKAGIDRERDLHDEQFAEHVAGAQNYYSVRFAGGEVNALTGE